MKKKQKKYDRIKAIKKNNRETQQPHGKAGVHVDKKERRKHKDSTDEFLDEVSEETDDGSVKQD